MNVHRLSLGMAPPGLKRLGLARPVLLRSPGQDSVQFGASTTASGPRPIAELVGSHPNPVKLVVSDYDGTIQIAYGRVPESARNAIQAVQGAGIQVVIATGRPYQDMPPIYENLGIKCGIYITEHGAVIWEVKDGQAKIIHRAYIDKDLIAAVEKQLDAFNLSLEKRGQADQQIHLLLYKDGIPHSATITTKTATDFKRIEPIENFEDFAAEGKITKLLLYSPTANTDLLKDFEQQLQNDLSGTHQFNSFISAVKSCELTAKNASKGEAVAFVAKRLGIELENVAVVGDDHNDVSMAKTVNPEGLSIAMGNAREDMMTECQYRTDLVEENGFATAMDNILENNKRLASLEVGLAAG